jgi:hypothetical protein
MRRWIRFIPILLLLFAVGATNLLRYDTPSYTVFTDLPKDDAREACIRMDKMAREYRARTRDFAGNTGGPMPFYLYKHREDFLATGAPKNGAGYFNGRELVAMAPRLDERAWHVIQHEGFHQFVYTVIRGDIPIWVNEGMAEYFGEAIYTGDGFVSGVIPQWRLERVRKAIAADKFKPLTEMMSLSHQQWNAELAVVNYDQGWAMVQFLAHGDNQKYQKPFGAFMSDVGAGKQWQKAWDDRFGGTDGFEKAWREYWTKLPENPTIDLYAQANVATWTSYLARAFSQQQKFESFEALRDAGKKGELRFNSEDWLPASLLATALEDSEALIKHNYSYALASRTGERTPQLICTMPDGRQVIGRFNIIGGHPSQVRADVSGKKQ